MADVIREKANTFASGLIMDLSPTTVPATAMTNALNATLSTNNGNEGSLQQDMGNGRVETAYLPEGYVPVGTCEFGDIIYVVSYNPLQNKSQIGCFPSPERNVTTEETGGLKQSVSAEEFQQMSGGKPNGVVNAMTLKKILYDNQKMNPGDRFVVYVRQTGTADSLAGNSEKLTDYGNTAHAHGGWPKMVNVRVVSMEDSGRITDLNADVKWYDNDYYLNRVAEEGGDEPDIDSYRSLVSSAYSVFRGKVSGRLALMFELEAIDSFSASYEVFTEKRDTTEDVEVDDGEGGTRIVTRKSGEEIVYDIWFHTSWGSSSPDVSPVGFLVTRSEWTNDQYGGFVGRYSEKDGGYYYPDKDEEKEPLPCLTDVSDGGGYDYSELKRYARTYEMEKPGDSYEEFLNDLSYESKIDGILDWCYEGTGEFDGEGKEIYRHKAIQNEDEYVDLRSVTRITKAVDGDGRYIVEDGSGERRVMCWYNLDSISGDAHYTKAAHGVDVELCAVPLNDDVVVNAFASDVPTRLPINHIEKYEDGTEGREPLEEYKIMTADTVYDEEGNATTYRRDLSGLVWNWTLAPAMPYGVLENLAASGVIDFSKVGTGQIDLTAWRYYNSGELCTLTWGLDVYSEANMGVAEVDIDFYDNQGFCAGLRSTGKTSYSGTFTESVVLNEIGGGGKLYNTDAYGTAPPHAGAFDSEGTVGFRDEDSTCEWWDNIDDKSKYTQNADDCGTLYANNLYMARITVKYGARNALGFVTADNTVRWRTFYRWLWTNGMFNEYYYNVDDFNVLKPTLELDFAASLDTRGSAGTVPMEVGRAYYRPEIGTLEWDDGDVPQGWSTVGSLVQFVNQDGAADGAGNVLMTFEAVIAEPFDTFSFDKERLGMVDVTVRMGPSAVVTDPETPSLNSTSGKAATSADDLLMPRRQTEFTYDGWDYAGYAVRNYGSDSLRVTETLLDALGVEPLTDGTEYGKNDVDEMWNEGGYVNYLDSFSLNLIGGEVQKDEEDVKYIDSDGNEQTLDAGKYVMLSTTLDRAVTDPTGKYDETDGYAAGHGVRLSLAGTAFSKIYARSLVADSEAKVLRHIMRRGTGATDSAEMLGLFYFGSDSYFQWHSGFLEFSHILTMGFGRKQRDSGYARAYIEQYRNVGGHIARKTDSDEMQSEKASLDSYACGYDDKENIQKDLVGWASGYPFCAFVIAETTTGVSNKWSTSYTYSDLSWHGWLNDYGYEYEKDRKRIHYQEVDIPTYTLKGWDIGDGNKDDEHYISVHGIMAYDYGRGLMTPTNDWMLGSYISQNEGLKPYNWHHVMLAREDDDLGSLANMLGSLFSQLYVVDGSNKTVYCRLEDVTYPETYSEVWQREMIVDMEFTGDYKADEDDENEYDTGDFLVINRMLLNGYLDFIARNSDVGVNSDDHTEFCSEVGLDLNNVSIELAPKRRDILFRFNMGYDLGDLRTDYVGMTETRNRLFPGYLNDDGTVPGAVVTTTAVTENTLYCLTDAGSVTQFGSGASMRYARRFRLLDDDGNELDWVQKHDEDNKQYIELPEGNLYMVRGDKAIDSQSFSGLSKIIEYIDGYVRMNDLSQMTNFTTTYKLCWRNRHDDSKVSDIEISGLPRASMFHHIYV